MFGKKKKERIGLLLGGGGARAAYQVGVLKAIAELTPKELNNPFEIISGTSAGSINAAALASNTYDFHHGVEKIISVWSNFRIHHVFRADSGSLLKRIFAWLWSSIGFGKTEDSPDSLLDNTPLRQLLEHYINLPLIQQAIDEEKLYGFCINACSYTTGRSICFYQAHRDVQPWSRTSRLGRPEKITIDHLMASSAIPVIFPSVKIGREYFGDGTMRQNAPISPVLHLGAKKVLVIGVRMEPKLHAVKRPIKEPGKPTLAQIAGYILDTLFLNSIYADVERMERINSTLDNVPKSETDQLKKIEHLIISPTQDIASLALKHFESLPRGFRTALKLLGMHKGNSRRFISYLMFNKAFCNELIKLGYSDAMQQKEELCKFLEIC